MITNHALTPMGPLLAIFFFSSLLLILCKETLKNEFKNEFYRIILLHLSQNPSKRSKREHSPDIRVRDHTPTPPPMEVDVEEPVAEPVAKTMPEPIVAEQPVDEPAAETTTGLKSMEIDHAAEPDETGAVTETVTTELPNVVLVTPEEG